MAVVGAGWRRGEWKGGVLQRCLQLLRGFECLALSLKRSWVSLSQRCCDPTGGEDLAGQGRDANPRKARGWLVWSCADPRAGLSLSSQFGSLQGCCNSSAQSSHRFKSNIGQGQSVTSQGFLYSAIASPRSNSSLCFAATSGPTGRRGEGQEPSRSFCASLPCLIPEGSAPPASLSLL